jgi:hypothetical protein
LQDRSLRRNSPLISPRYGLHQRKPLRQCTKCANHLSYYEIILQNVYIRNFP